MLSNAAPPAWRVNGKLIRRRVSADELGSFVRKVLTKEQLARFDHELEMNVAHRFGELGRFRINVFRQRATWPCGRSRTPSPPLPNWACRSGSASWHCSSAA
jgi:Tfp pilus assembly pilus retraction ATPase PilT